MTTPAHLNRRTLLAAGGTAAALALAACGGDEATGPTENSDGTTTLRVGATPLPHAEILQFVADELAADAGLALEIEEYTDYQIPNRVLADGEIDANFFQHVPFLEQQIEEKGYELSRFEGIHIEPMGVFSESLGSLEELQDGDEVALPNDPTNRGRAIALLAAEGLLALADGVEPVDATFDDIAENPLNLTLTELDAAVIGRTLGDFAAAVINGNYAIEAGLSPAEDALVLESGQDNPYANILAVRSENVEDEAIVKLDELLHSPEVAAFIEETYADGSVIPAF